MTTFGADKMLVTLCNFFPVKRAKCKLFCRSWFLISIARTPEKDGPTWHDDVVGQSYQI